MSSSFGIAKPGTRSEPRRDGTFWRFVRRIAGTVVAPCGDMFAAARLRERWLPTLLAAVFVVLALGPGPAWSALGGGHGGGFSGGGHGGQSVPQGREFRGGGFRGRPGPHGHDRDGRSFFVFPYYYDPYYGYDPYYPAYPYDAYCDPYSPYYAPQYC
jgi:hypothetical protein